MLERLGSPWKKQQGWTIKKLPVVWCPKISNTWQPISWSRIPPRYLWRHCGEWARPNLRFSSQFLSRWLDITAETLGQSSAELGSSRLKKKGQWTMYAWYLRDLEGFDWILICHMLRHYVTVGAMLNFSCVWLTNCSFSYHKAPVGLGHNRDLDWT